MLWRVRSSRGRPQNAPAAFIYPCRPNVAKRPPRGPGWVHELKHDGYRLQIHIRDGRVRLYTMNAADWSARYPLIVEDATRIKGAAIIDAEVVCAGKDGVPDFDRLHGRCFDHLAYDSRSKHEIGSQSCASAVQNTAYQLDGRRINIHKIAQPVMSR